MLKSILPLIVLAAIPSVVAEPRVVSGGGAITETLFALGAGKLLVAVDSTSQLLPETKGLPGIGYARALSAEGILSVDPGLILLNADAGPPAVVEQLKASGVPVRQFGEVNSAESALQRLRDIGEAVQRPAETAALVAGVRQTLAELAALTARDPARPKVLFIYTRGGGTMNVSGRGTSADTMIRLAGGENAVTGYEGFKPLTAEGVVNAAPDVILLPARGLARAGGIDEVLEQPGVALTPAGRTRRILAMDDALLLGFGPRFATAAMDLHRLLFPGAQP